MHKIWIHDESLGLARNMDSFFILDWKFFTSRAWSAKRIYFVLSVLRNSGVEIIEGDTLEVLTDLETQVKTYELPMLRTLIWQN